jgi:hypothetical protein
MRIAVIAEIHGNLRAFEAVQADLRAQSPDLVVNLRCGSDPESKEAAPRCSIPRDRK